MTQKAPISERRNCDLFR